MIKIFSRKIDKSLFVSFLYSLPHIIPAKALYFCVIKYYLTIVMLHNQIHTHKKDCEKNVLVYIGMDYGKTLEKKEKKCTKCIKCSSRMQS